MIRSYYRVQEVRAMQWYNKPTTYVALRGFLIENGFCDVCLKRSDDNTVYIDHLGACTLVVPEGNYIVIGAVGITHMPEEVFDGSHLPADSHVISSMVQLKKRINTLRENKDDNA